MVVRWTFFDPATDETYTFAINPNEGGSPALKKSFTYQATAAPDGQTLIFQGRRQPQSLDFSGTLLSQAEYDAFASWWERQNQVRVTDDLGRQYWVVIGEFEPKRVRAASHPWKHTYTVRAPILDVPG